MDARTDAIWKYALANAAKYGGTCNEGSVLAAMIKEFPDAKRDIPRLKADISEVAGKVNALGMHRIQERLEREFPQMLERKEREKNNGLKDLEGVDAKKCVVMRFAPSPSGPMHIGHAITGGLTSLYVKKYGGRFILRIEDTNSDNIDPDAYRLLPEDAAWVFGNVTEVWIQSDRMETYYSYADRMLRMGALYVCTCSQEAFKACAERMKDCPCRQLPVDENMRRWSAMFTSMKEGDAVVRFKSSMQDRNPAMRDFPLFRINDSTHPRTGTRYRVWPLMNFSVMVDDVEAGMTHIIRAKDHADNAKRQEMMLKVLGKPFPKTYFLGRYNFEGMELSCSKTKKRILAGDFSGWDDIRLPFLQALKRRGYRPEVFLKYTMLTGLSPVDKHVSREEFFKTIDAFNKELIDRSSRRFFFVYDAQEITIHKAPKVEVHLRAHPDDESLGMRTISAHGKFLVQKKDLADLKDGELVRLMDCLNFRKEDEAYVFDSKGYEKFKDVGKRIIHYLPAGDTVPVSVLMDDGRIIEGHGESGLTALNVGDVIQFERFGFCRLDAKEGERLKFWWTHS